MPKLTGPLFSVEARKDLGKAITYQRRPGGASVYGYKQPKVPLTDRQLWQRNLIRWCVYQWQQLSDVAKAEWEDKAKGLRQSGYSLFINQRRGYLFDPDVLLYLPLYDTRLKGNIFSSMDSYGKTCTSVGSLWTPQGRKLDGLDDYLYFAPQSSSAWTVSFCMKSELSKNFDLFNRGLNGGRFYVGTTPSIYVRWRHADGSYYTYQLTGWETWKDTLKYISITYADGYIDTYINGVWKKRVHAGSQYSWRGTIQFGHQSMQVYYKGLFDQIMIDERALNARWNEFNFNATKFRYN